MSHAVGDAGLILSLSVVVFGLAAVAWAFFAPTMDVTVTATRSLEVVPGTEGAQFQAYGAFALVFLFLGVLSGLWAFATRRRGVGILLWLICAMTFASWWALFVGASLRPVFHGAHDNPDAILPGQVIHIAGAAQPGVILLCAPTMALLAYWLSAVFHSAESFSDNDR